MLLLNSGGGEMFRTWIHEGRMAVHYYRLTKCTHKDVNNLPKNHWQLPRWLESCGPQLPLIYTYQNIEKYFN